MPMPSREQCLALLKKYNVPERIARHSIAVEKLAVSLAEKFNAKGIKVDTVLVSRASLLHDIDKLQTIPPKSGHGKVSQKILESEGFPRIAKIALRHNLDCILSPTPFDSWEEKIVYYTDKRIIEDKTVSLNERFEYLFETYGKEKTIFGKIAECKPRVEQLEKEIFSNLDITPSLEGL